MLDLISPKHWFFDVFCVEGGASPNLVTGTPAADV